ncbi:hypothetical protein CEJ86_07205 [Sinorhizobium meliloti]|uniref:Uncharacterized protein n=1 Tax=Rhizobium meliloti TaxID=382 RepID=A0A2J0Z7Q7_RHIML|nr:hypothetical protein CEJ86_07205 [Sinorhizobium meliloti]
MQVSPAFKVAFRNACRGLCRSCLARRLFGRKLAGGDVIVRDGGRAATHRSGSLLLGDGEIVERASGGDGNV